MAILSCLSELPSQRVRLYESSSALALLSVDDLLLFVTWTEPVGLWPLPWVVWFLGSTLYLSPPVLLNGGISRSIADASQRRQRYGAVCVLCNGGTGVPLTRRALETFIG